MLRGRRTWHWLTMVTIIFALAAPPVAPNKARAEVETGANTAVELSSDCAGEAYKAFQQTGPNHLEAVDRCLDRLFLAAAALTPTEQHNIGTETFMRFPCFGLGKQKDRIAQWVVNASRKIGDFDLAITALFNRGVCYWNDRPAQFAKAMKNFAPFRDVLGPYLNPSYLDTEQEIVDQAFAFRVMGRRYVRFLENAQRVDRDGGLCGGVAERCARDAWRLAEQLKARLFHARMLQVQIANDRQGALARLAQSQYQLVQERESYSLGIAPFISGELAGPQPAQDRLARVETEMRANFPAYAIYREQLSPTFEQVQASLRPDETLISYLFSDADETADRRDRGVLAFVISKSAHPQFVRLPIGNIELKHLVAQLNEGIALGVPLANLSPLLRDLGDRLVMSLKIAPKTRIIFEVDEALASMPFGLLVVGSEQLGVRNRVSYSPSSGLFIESRKLPTSKSPTLGYVGFGAGTFREGMPALRAVKTEIETGASYYEPNVLYVNAEAKKSEIYRQARAIASASVVHLATHTDWVGGQFALVFHEGDGEDGLLTEKDILAHIRTSADIVILSGCDTARLDAASNAPGEAFSSLARAFFAVGAKSILVSQWRVDDEKSKSFVSAFLNSYSNNRNAEAALAEARANVKAIPGASPQDWAGWIVVGT